jgi:glycosyltransferase involved in cell wall biosynthesis
MIKNTRMYQLLSAKLKYDVLAVPAAYALRSFFRTKLKAEEKVKKEIIEIGNNNENLEKLSDIFPKPLYDNGDYPQLAEADGTILSVIIPAYKAADYLAVCLDNIFNQNLSFPFEVIMVNDGSPDNTDEAVKPYLKNKNFRYIKQANRGAASARNTGLEQARGKYVSFADADDAVLSNAFSIMVETAEKAQADIVVGGWKCCNEAGRMLDEYKMAECIYSGDNIIECKDIPGVPWGKLYKRELFKSIRFPKNYRSFEDTNIRFLIFREAKKIVSIPNFVYLWKKSQDGITDKAKNSPSALQTYWIIEDMLADNDRLSLPEDEMFYVILLSQLSYINYNRLKGIDEKVTKTVFAASCALYEKYSEKCPNTLPYSLKIAHRSLQDRDFGLWKLQGKYYRMIS